MDWRTFDGGWRYAIRGDETLVKTQFPKFPGKYGNARNVRAIVLEPALYQITGRNKDSTHRVSSNLCKMGTMDHLTVYRRMIKGKDWEIIGRGSWQDMKDVVTSNRNNGKWTLTIAVLFLDAELAPYDKTDGVGDYKKTAINQIGYIQLSGFGISLGWKNSAVAAGQDPDNCAGKVIENLEMLHQPGKGASDKDKYYPIFTFREFSEFGKSADKLEEIGNKAYDVFASFLEAHLDHYAPDGDEDAEPDDDDTIEAPEEETPEDMEDYLSKLPADLRAQVEAALVKKEKRKPRKTKTEKKQEEVARKAAGEEKFEKVEEEVDDGFEIPDDLPF